MLFGSRLTFAASKGTNQLDLLIGWLPLIDNEKSFCASTQSLRFFNSILISKEIPHPCHCLKHRPGLYAFKTTHTISNPVGINS